MVFRKKISRIFTLYESGLKKKKIKNAKETLQQNGFERFHGKNQCDVWDKDFFPTRLEVPEPDDEQLVKAKPQILYTAHIKLQ